MAHVRRRLNWIAPAVIVVCSVLGGVVGPLVSDASAATNEDEISQAVRTFTKVYSTVEQNFADKVTSDKAIYKGAIGGMLRTLDPHSSFFANTSRASCMSSQDTPRPSLGHITLNGPLSRKGPPRVPK